MRALIASLVCLVLAAPLHAQNPAPLPDLNHAEAPAADLFQQTGATGMVVIIVRDQQVFFHGYGETAPGSGQTPDAHSILRLCSLSKIFASDLLVKLAADNLVRLDDPLQNFAPPHHEVPGKSGHPITLSDLATHTSGLPRELGPSTANTTHFTFPNYAQRWQWLPRQHLKTVPGTAALYSNLGFDLLGDALQTAAGKPYATLLAERTTGPLGMTETGFTPNPGQCARLLQSAHDQGPCTDTQPSAGSSGLYSTATDITAWLKYLLGTSAPAQSSLAQAVYIHPENLLSEQGLDHAGKPTGIGLGWMHLLPPDDPAHLIEKTGGGAGFSTYIVLNQSHHTALFLALTDGAGGYRMNAFKEANNLLLALDSLPPIPPDPPKPIRKPRKLLRHHPPQAR